MIYCFYNKTNYTQIYIWNKTLHVSDSSSVRHQEFFTVNTVMLYVTQVCWQLASKFRTELAGSGRNQLRPDSAHNLSTNMYFILQQNQTSSILILLTICQKTCISYCSRTNPVPSWSCSQAVNKHVRHIPLLCVQWTIPGDGNRNCPKYAELYSKNKFEKLMHLVDFL